MNGEQDPNVLKYLKRQSSISEADVERFQWTVRALVCHGVRSTRQEEREGRVE